MLPIDIAKSMSIIERVISIYIYIYIYIYIDRHRDLGFIFLTISPTCVQVYIEIYRVGDNRGTVTRSTSPHISDQLGTENLCYTLLC